VKGCKNLEFYTNRSPHTCSGREGDVCVEERNNTTLKCLFKFMCRV
jgi:hypothetical protein